MGTKPAAAFAGLDGVEGGGVDVARASAGGGVDLAVKETRPVHMALRRVRQAAEFRARPHGRHGGDAFCGRRGQHRV
ncbi:unnamed protein product [Chondrus crispus]|uniref:Uncharacterized protein n=1 Tax=Chondrus crispus TaxID=2769 RepID=R7QC63_CHOCR|nr:unnamed protein product [Chondrus crispus]CDF35045.1 unnamed protein product [Chondrus crispus]|eukprot:XP_005714864.1 unnamed protein product [Chondrus crispus]